MNRREFLRLAGLAAAGVAGIAVIGLPKSVDADVQKTAGRCAHKLTPEHRARLLRMQAAFGGVEEGFRKYAEACGDAARIMWEFRRAHYLDSFGIPMSAFGGASQSWKARNRRR